MPAVHERELGRDLVADAAGRAIVVEGRVALLDPGIEGPGGVAGIEVDDLADVVDEGLRCVSESRAYAQKEKGMLGKKLVEAGAVLMFMYSPPVTRRAV